MVTTTTDPRRSERNGQAEPGLRVTPPARARWHARAPWLVLAVILVALGMLIAVVVLTQLTRRVPAVALANAVERGDQLTRADLRVLQVAVDGEVPLIDPANLDTVLGRTVTTALPAGALLSPDVLSRTDLVPAGSDVVGMALEPGSLPVDDLRPGDTVGVFAAGEEREANWITNAEVHTVGALAEGTAAQFVAVIVPTETVTAVTAAAARDEARLVLKGSSR